MDHQKYKSIQGVWSTKELAYYQNHEFTFEDVEWCITEKAHGANFSYYISSKEKRLAKRNGFLAEGELFYQCQKMDRKCGWKIENIWNHLIKTGKNPEEMIVYGELCGGNYPHKEVEQDNSIRMVQKGVWYSPNLEFYIFDIKLNGNFLSMDEVVDLCKNADLLYARILFRGTFNECLEYPNDFITKIPGYLGLEYYPIKENICEGWVLKPVEAKYLDSGARAILKSKNKKFSENSRLIGEKNKDQKDLSAYGEGVYSEIWVYINENRLRNVLSNFGNFGKKDFGKILGLFLKDIYESFNTNFNYMDRLSKEDRRILGKIVNKDAVLVWRPIFLAEKERDE